MPGATTVGLVCREGVVLASERRYSFGIFVMSKAAKKMFKVFDTVGFACAGVIGDMQVLVRGANACVSIYRFVRGRVGSVRKVAKLICHLLSSRRIMPELALS